MKNVKLMIHNNNNNEKTCFIINNNNIILLTRNGIAMQQTKERGKTFILFYFILKVNLHAIYFFLTCIINYT